MKVRDSGQLSLTAPEEQGAAHISIWDDVPFYTSGQVKVCLRSATAALESGRCRWLACALAVAVTVTIAAAVTVAAICSLSKSPRDAVAVQRAGAVGTVNSTRVQLPVTCILMAPTAQATWTASGGIPGRAREVSCSSWPPAATLRRVLRDAIQAVLQLHGALGAVVVIEDLGCSSKSPATVNASLNVAVDVGKQALMVVTLLMKDDAQQQVATEISQHLPDFVVSDVAFSVGQRTEKSASKGKTVGGAPAALSETPATALQTGVPG